MHEVYYGDLVFAMTKGDFVEGRDKKPCSFFCSGDHAAFPHLGQYRLCWNARIHRQARP